jgi:hypothetical protein
MSARGPNVPVQQLGLPIRIQDGPVSNLGLETILRYVRICLSRSRKIPEEYLKLSPDLFLLHHSEFVVY